MRIFDFHLHPGYDFHAPELDHAAFAAPLKQQGIVKCCGSFISKRCQQLGVEEYAKLLPQYNRLAWEFHDIEPDFFIPGIHIHPALFDMSVDEICKHHQKGGVLIGELVPPMMGWDFAHENFMELLSYIRDLDMAVSIHPTGDLSEVDKIMQNLPGLKIVLAHLSGYGLYERTLELMKRFDTVYTDLSAHGNDFDGTVADAVNKIGSERILYGSDYPGYDVRPFIDIVVNADISETAKENILYRNAAALLCLNGGK